MSDSVLLLGHPSGPLTILKDNLGPCDLVSFPQLKVEDGQWGWSWQDELAQWEQTASAGDTHSRVVVCCWDPDVGSARSFVDVGAGEWIAEVEQRMTLWFLAVRAAARRCADGGSLVVVVERPSALDSIGWAPLVAAAEGVISVTRSVAAAQGKRGLRANAVTTELWTAPDEMLGMAPPLGVFPGRIDHEVVGAIRYLLSDDACGVTASVTTPDGGRTT